MTYKICIYIIRKITTTILWLSIHLFNYRDLHKFAVFMYAAGSSHRITNEPVVVDSQRRNIDVKEDQYGQNNSGY